MSKRILDIVGATIGLLLFLPFLVLIAALVKLTSVGPVFFVQERIGLEGKNFKMIKFRTMISDAENTGTGLFSYEDDPRITSLGQFLRRKSLDELPQLINVLTGSMALVGPRPPVTYELGNWDDYTHEMRKRFQVKPGITGLAQVSGRNNLSWDEKIVYDNDYVDLFSERGIGLDFSILFQTVAIVLYAKDTVEAKTDGKEQGNISARAITAGKKKKGP